MCHLDAPSHRCKGLSPKQCADQRESGTLSPERDGLVISTPVVYFGDEQAHHRETPPQARRNRESLPESERPSGTKPLADPLAGVSRKNRSAGSRASPAPGMIGFAVSSVATTTRDPGARRHHNPGGTFMLSSEQQAQLHQALDEPPPDGGLWSGPKVAHWIVEQTGRKVPPPSAGGSISSDCTPANVCCLRAMPKLTLRPKRTVKNPGFAANSHPAGVPRSDRGAVGHRSPSQWAQTDPAMDLGAQRDSPTGHGPPALPMALCLQVCASPFRNKRSGCSCQP
jgi:hypothetical protein